jgi:hypothetical protein
MNDFVNITSCLHWKMCLLARIFVVFFFFFLEFGTNQAMVCSICDFNPLSRIWYTFIWPCWMFHNIFCLIQCYYLFLWVNNLVPFLVYAFSCAADVK